MHHWGTGISGQAGIDGPVEVALQRMFAAEDVPLFAQGQCSITEAIETLERLALEWKLASRWKIRL